MRRRAGVGLVGLLVTGLCACGGLRVDGLGAGDPRGAALRLFELADDGEPDARLLTLAFAAPPAGEHERAALLDALAALAAHPAPRVVELTQPAGPKDAFVDLEAALPGGGLARFVVRLERPDEGGWRVSWFQGPGVEWPATLPRGDGLTSSAPPERAR